jgi:hypothetical protein
MSGRCPEITQTTSISDAIKITEEQGAALMREHFDFSRLGSLAALYGIDLRPGVYTADSDAESPVVEKVIEAHPVLREIQENLEKQGHPKLNMVGLMQFTLGFTLPPHADDRFVVEGVSLLIPRSHSGDFALHGDDWFEVTDWESTGGRRTRRTLQKDSGQGPFMERRSNYHKGDVLFLRQDIPYLGLKAKLHSAASCRREGDRAEKREVLTFDHVIK